MALVEPFVGTYYSAKKAINDIDYNSIVSNCGKIVDDCEGFKELATSVNSAGSDLTADVLNYQGNTYGDKVIAVSSSIADTYSSISADCDTIIAAAEAEYNRIQTEYNEEAIAENNRLKRYWEDYYKRLASKGN